MRVLIILTLSCVYNFSAFGQTMEFPVDTMPEKTTTEKAPLIKKKKDSAKLTFSGRVFARDVFSKTSLSGADWRQERSVDSARLSAVYKRKWMSMQVEFDVAGGDADLKDGYIRIQPNKTWRLQAGRFKRPMGMMSLTSKWELPVTERGILSTMRVGDVKLSFTQIRGDGLMLRYRLKTLSKRKLTVTAGIFQNSLGTNDTLLLGASDFAQDLYGRVAFAWNKHIEIASGLATFPYVKDFSGSDALRHGVAISAEAKLEYPFGALWFSGFTGKNMWAPYTLTPGTAGRFTALQALLMARWGRDSKPKKVEPFLMFSYFDLSHKVSNDATREWGGGINIRVVKDWRVTLDYLQRTPQGSNSPTLGLKTVTLQLGARFKNLGLE